MSFQDDIIDRLASLFQTILLTTSFKILCIPIQWFQLLIEYGNHLTLTLNELKECNNSLGLISGDTTNKACSLSSLLSHFPNLKLLQIKGYQSFIIDINDFYYNIKELSVCSQLTLEDLSLITTYLPNLNKFDYYEVNNNILIMYSKLKFLTQINILLKNNQSEDINEGLSMIGQQCKQIKNLAICYYQSLNLSGMIYFTSLSSIYFQLTLHLKDIQYLCNCKSLKTISLQISPINSNQTLNEIGHYLPQLTSISFMECSFSDEAIYNLVNQCTLLTELILNCIYSQQSLMYISEYCPNITKLIYEYKYFDENGFAMKELLTKCLNLNYLSIHKSYMSEQTLNMIGMYHSKKLKLILHSPLLITIEGFDNMCELMKNDYTRISFDEWECKFLNNEFLMLKEKYKNYPMKLSLYIFSEKLSM